MAKYASAPLSELSVAVQFGGRLPLTPRSAIKIYEEVEKQFPKLELKQPIGSLGAIPLPTFEVVSDDIQPRYWFSSEDDYFLTQVQADMIAFNWRKRSLPGEPSANPYPGFKEMARRHKDLTDVILKILDVSELPPLSAINLYYDNVWRVNPEASHGAAHFFKFWNRLGIRTLLGPEVKMAVAVQDESLGPAARVDVIATMANAQVLNQPMLVGRLVLSALGYPPKFDDVPNALDKLHERVTELFEQILTDDARQAWR